MANRSNPRSDSAVRPIVLVKLGGSLITDKRRPNTPHPETIDRLASEVAQALSRPESSRKPRLVIGHGSGSFGHEAAQRAGIRDGLSSPNQLPGVAETRERAATLNGIVVAALVRAGVPAFSIAPSSCLVCNEGAPEAFASEALLRALDLGLVPVVFGDVVLDRQRGVSIASTEIVLTAVADALIDSGSSIDRAIWLGDTPGIWNEQGDILAEVDPSSPEPALAAAGGSAGTDVTGGMAHRLETALKLAGQGVASLIADGREPGNLLGALASDTAESIAGTWIRRR